MDDRAKESIEPFVRAGRRDRWPRQHEVNRQAGRRAGSGGQAAMVRPAPARGDKDVGIVGQRRTYEEFQVPQLVPTERQGQEVLPLDPDVGAAAEDGREARQSMER